MLELTLSLALILAPIPQAIDIPDQAEVEALEACLFGTEDVRQCGDFSEDMDSYGSCLEAVAWPTQTQDFANELDAALEAHLNCQFELPCFKSEPPEGLTVRTLRYCAARQVAVERSLADRWEVELWGRGNTELDQLLSEAKTMALARGVELDQKEPTEDYPYMGRALSWSSWANALAILRARVKAGNL